MTAAPRTVDTGEEGRRDLDALRRRLYGPDASDEDLQRYLRAREPEASSPEPIAKPPAGRRRLLLGAGTAAVLLAGAVIVAGAPGRTVDPPAAAPTTASRRFQEGATAIDGPTPVAVSIEGVAAVGRRYQGYGPALVPIETPEAELEGGRALVDVTSIEPEQVAWRALLRLDRGDGPLSSYVLAQGIAQNRSGAHAPTTFVFARRPLTHIAISAPDDVAWTLVVALTDRIAPDLR